MAHMENLDKSNEKRVCSSMLLFVVILIVLECFGTAMELNSMFQTDIAIADARSTFTDVEQDRGYLSASFLLSP